jgi:hypothetical protein
MFVPGRRSFRACPYTDGDFGTADGRQVTTYLLDEVAACSTCGSVVYAQSGIDRS